VASISTDCSIPAVKKQIQEMVAEKEGARA